MEQVKAFFHPPLPSFSWSRLQYATHKKVQSGVRQTTPANGYAERSARTVQCSPVPLPTSMIYGHWMYTHAFQKSAISNRKQILKTC